IVAGILSPQRDLLEMTCVAFGAVLFLVHVMVAVQRIQQSARNFKTANQAAISHEIRTPMNAVVAAGGLLRRTELTEEQAAHVSMLEDSTEVLLGLLN